jgi:epoxyqueuosine reductase QueG
VTFALDAVAFDAACAPVAPGLTLASLLSGARAALIVGAAGRAFFEAFARARAAGALADGPDPLDRYTRAVVDETTRAALAPLGVAHATHFPFMGASVVVPFQRLGRAAGLAATSPLGLQIHPIYGAWWAYRALIVVGADLTPSAPLADACAGCPAPCVTACPGGAARVAGFDVPACHARRRADEACHLSCVARRACIRGPEHRYSDAQLAFHMMASMPA